MNQASCGEEVEAAKQVVKYGESVISLYHQRRITNHLAQILLKEVHHDEHRGKRFWRSSDHNVMDFSCEFVFLDLSQTDHYLQLSKHHF
jgi:hypothetical protein